MPTAFRLATDADIDVYRAWFADPVLAGRLSEPTPDWRRHVRTEGCALWVALDDQSRPVAFFQTETDEHGMWIDAAIDPARRGQGRMAAILRDFLAGPMADAQHVIAEVEADNAASLALLVRCGFVEQPRPATPGFRRFELTRPGRGS